MNVTRPRPGHAVALAVLLTLVPATAVTQGPDAPLAVVVERVTQYAEGYERTVAAMAMEEDQTQRLERADGRVKETRVLRSDFLLIKTGPEWAQVFRDVIEVDGKPIRNRDERLRKLFLDKPRTAVQQAQAIAAESRRHNIGPIRYGNSPLLPMIFVHPRYVHRCRFSLAGGVLAFEEVQMPTVLGFRHSGGPRMDLPAKGSLTVDPSTGRILSGALTAATTAGSYSISLSVEYADEPTLKLMVPVHARELYDITNKPAGDLLLVESRYTNFRRFEVSVGEQIKVPK